MCMRKGFLFSSFSFRMEIFGWILEKHRCSSILAATKWTSCSNHRQLSVNVLCVDRLINLISSHVANILFTGCFQNVNIVSMQCKLCLVHLSVCNFFSCIKGSPFYTRNQAQIQCVKRAHTHTQTHVRDQRQ